ncbi:MULTISPECIES: hypothetical protein [Photorhabdus]|uniref:Uncharacterized protein n=2 Tax=Photorhabdus asymbiotica TaxID=291112 RepID=B6VNL4_PHOAA|nr:hypothetical protein [Photorhabdus asymbiotica]RKS59284.1 hypothetical protein BDD30_1348 [Photorhabdus asymbiotica]CAQ85410.1 conserved hypothetical protein [Photorhabdus asymbiotica]CAR67744.1 Hypothetical protein PA-RVA20-21-0137 [Photorhabdus asymbiotica subsp. asymbiotica ATCC 43949]
MANRDCNAAWKISKARRSYKVGYTSTRHEDRSTGCWLYGWLMKDN